MLVYFGKFRNIYHTALAGKFSNQLANIKLSLLVQIFNLVKFETLKFSVVENNSHSLPQCGQGQALHVIYGIDTVPQ